MQHIIVIGAGQAGASLAVRLRALGYDGRLTLIGEESVPPYQRPPLSKQYLTGKMEAERLFLHPVQFYDEADIGLRLGVKVRTIDVKAGTIRVGNETLAYDQLALTTGSRPRYLPAAFGGTLGGVHVVRTLADVDAMSPAFRAGARLLIVGGGYVGLEAAAVAAQRGLEVTLVEMAERILQRVASPETSAWFRALHARHGVSIREGVGLDRLIGETRVRAARLSDGSEVDVDFVIVGIGITPATRLAEEAGLVLENGIRTDALGRSSAPAVWAAGDCASFPWRGKRIRLESVQNAIDHAELVAANMLGGQKAYAPLPWFWSDQYDVKLQIAGLSSGHDEVVARAGAREGAQSFWYFRGDTLLAVDAMNDPRAYMVGKRLLEGGRTAEKASLLDPATDLKALLG